MLRKIEQATGLLIYAPDVDMVQSMVVFTEK